MKLSDARYDELLELATVDCYDKEEEFSGVLTMLEDILDFPLKATLAGVPVIVRGIDSQHSTLRRGIVAIVEREDKRYAVGLVDLDFSDLAPKQDEWIAMVQRWAQ